MGDDGDLEKDESQLLEIAREEAHRTVDNQINTLGDIDDKAARIIRLNLILLGILLTGFSIIASNDGAEPITTNTASIMNIYSVLGLVSILLSTILAAFTYTATSQRAGMSGRDIDDMISNDYSPIENYRGLIRGYSKWMQYNFKVNTRNAPLSSGILLFLIYAIILFSAGVYQAFIQKLGIEGACLIFILLTVITWKSGIFGQVKRYWEYKDFEPGKD